VRLADQALVERSLDVGFTLGSPSRPARRKVDRCHRVLTGDPQMEADLQYVRPCLINSSSFSGGRQWGRRPHGRQGYGPFAVLLITIRPSCELRTRFDSGVMPHEEIVTVERAGTAPEHLIRADQVPGLTDPFTAAELTTTAWEAIGTDGGVALGVVASRIELP
jgi:hypothetical protein